MDKKEIFRRILHSMAWIYLIFYIFPTNIFGFHRKILLLFVIIVILSFEALRIHFGFQVFGMRSYEKRQIAAYAWATMAASIGLFSFPMHLNVLCLIGMGIADPIIGELNKYKPEYYPYLPLLIWAIIGIITLTILTNFSIVFILMLSAVGSITAIGIEKPNLVIDDDFLMVLVPLVILRIIELMLI
ncbi:MAG: hypothetical protein ACOC6U_00670 [Thermoplasmatota archaeon]